MRLDVSATLAVRILCMTSQWSLEFVEFQLSFFFCYSFRAGPNTIDLYSTSSFTQATLACITRFSKKDF